MRQLSIYPTNNQRALKNSKQSKLNIKIADTYFMKESISVLAYDFPKLVLSPAKTKVMKR
ncbi:MAG: hypothetical protein K0R69_1423 [Clostridia bacterium]|jgi:hypothetical protein|nr:hypothetical protein [Clostridia bacterium]